jgi:predicted nucleic acid-binding protein
MSHFVIDASIVLAAFLEEQSEYANKIVYEVIPNSLVFVPSLWHLEIRNVLILKEKKGKIPPGFTSKIIDTFMSYMVVTDMQVTEQQSLMSIDAMIRDYTITPYDATYIELALRLGIPLATLDREMVHVAQELGIEILL